MNKDILNNIYIKLSEGDINDQHHHHHHHQQQQQQTILVINTESNTIHHNSDNKQITELQNLIIQSTPTRTPTPPPLPSSSTTTTTNTSINIQNSKKRSSEHLDLNDDYKYSTHENKRLNLYNHLNDNKIQQPQHINTNTDEIFQILSQKIAKYCQILSDLTNCEVFFKSNLNSRSLYWGTYKMMFNYTHQGLTYDRNESLIKISGRAISNDVNNIIEELLNVDNNNSTSVTGTTTTTSTTCKNDDDTLCDVYQIQNRDNLIIRDLSVFSNRLDDNLYEKYLEKFERIRVFNNDDHIPNEFDLYDIDDVININDDDVYAQNDEIFMCDLCDNHSYKYLTQLKLHILKEHEKVPFPIHSPFQCLKCQSLYDTRNDYSRHLLHCYYPELFTCKICQQTFDNYGDILFHTRYIHTHVYVCSACQRKFKNVKELLDHDQLMHSKSLNYCDICYEAVKNRNELLKHYKDKHLNLNEHNLDINTTNINGNNSTNNNSNNINNNVNNNLTTQTLDISSIKTSSSQQFNIDQQADKLDSEITSSSMNESINSLNDTTNQENVTTTTTTTSGKISKVQKNDLIRGLLDRKHQCKWCTQRFYTKSQLKQHESTHVNAVLYCPVCDKEFTHKDRLAGHMKCHMEPSLECKICGKKFKRLCNLYNHELVHGLTEHAFMLCQFCGRGFRSRRDYQNHVIANHRDQLMKSEIIIKNNTTTTTTTGANTNTNLNINNGKQLSIIEAKNLLNSQITPIINKQIKQQSTNTSPSKSETFNYFSNLTQNTNTYVNENDNDLDENDDHNNNHNTNDHNHDYDDDDDDEDNNNNDNDDDDDIEHESKQDKQKQLNLNTTTTTTVHQPTQHNHVLRSHKKLNNLTSNTHLLVQAAEFVDNNNKT